jgi:hypothetical protein
MAAFCEISAVGFRFHLIAASQQQHAVCSIQPDQYVVKLRNTLATTEHESTDGRLVHGILISSERGI